VANCIVDVFGTVTEVVIAQSVLRALLNAACAKLAPGLRQACARLAPGLRRSHVTACAMLTCWLICEVPLAVVGLCQLCKSTVLDNYLFAIANTPPQRNNYSHMS